MIGRGRHGVALLAALLAIGTSGPGPARACAPQLRVIDIKAGTPLIKLPAEGFTLHWRHSVSLTPVEADYTLGPDGALIQTEERFVAHGPGMESVGDNWRLEDGWMIVALDRRIPALVMRSAPDYENRLTASGQSFDLTRWPGIPLEIELRPCKE